MSAVAIDEANSLSGHAITLGTICHRFAELAVPLTLRLLNPVVLKDKNLRPDTSLIKQKSKEGLQCNVPEKTRCRAGIKCLGNVSSAWICFL
jgi:hypothetical protein